MTNNHTATSPLSRFHVRRAVSVLAGISLAALVAACKTTPPPKADGKQLSAAEVQALYLAGTPTVSHGTSLDSGREWKLARDGSGAQSLAMVSTSYTDTGTYRIDGNRVCSKWVKIRNGAEACGYIHQTPDGKYQSVNDKGEKTSVFTITAGS